MNQSFSHVFVPRKLVNFHGLDGIPECNCVSDYDDLGLPIQCNWNVLSGKLTQLSCERLNRDSLQRSVTTVLLLCETPGSFNPPCILFYNLSSLFEHTLRVLLASTVLAVLILMFLEIVKFYKKKISCCLSETRYELIPS